MRDELLAYLLNDLDPEQRQRIEERLESDPIWQHELKRLQSYVDEANGSPADEADSIPDDLVNRTCSFVQQASAQGELSPATLPASLTESCDAAPPNSRRWSLMDFAVVAGIFVAIGTLLLPALRESREAARRLQCQEQLRTLGSALANYAERSHGSLPEINHNENAGMYSVKLVESGILTEQQLSELLVCPSSQLADELSRSKKNFRIPTRLELTEATGSRLRELRQRMGASFAYRVGFFDKEGNYHQVKFVGSSQAPVMADKPSFRVVGFQSANHNGCGQNVLFQDGHVEFVSFCHKNSSDEHLFLNEDNQHAAGNSELDIVLVRSEAGPLGLEAQVYKASPVD